MMKLQHLILPLLLAAPVALATGLPADSPDIGPQSPVPAPVRTLSLTLEQLAAAPGTLSLRGNLPDGLADFTVRRDEVVTRALVDVDFTPSPALLPLISQLKLYFNNELMGVSAFAKEQMGQRSQARFELEPRYAKDFNNLKFNFIGHYQRVCENPASDTLWLNINRDSRLTLQLQTLPVRNELSFFPMPFLDTRDEGKLVLPMVFAGDVSSVQQQAAAILASWFGVQAKWRGQHFPVLMDRVPKRNGIIFATNGQRPAFLRDYPKVSGPTIDMISAPDNPYVKLLLILGRDEQDLVTASKGIAQGNVLLRGQSVQVDAVTALAPRVPYDAPNWVRLDRPMRFAELLDYPTQLQASGYAPWPMNLTLRLPPDLYMAGSQGVKLNLDYHYSTPTLRNGSRLDMMVNGQFMKSYPLEPDATRGQQWLTLPLWLAGDDGSRALTMPGLKTSQANSLGFKFEYARQMMGGDEEGRCDLTLPPPHLVRIDDEATIDFTGYRHFIEMPDLRAFSGAGFPFSRLADLSQTQIVMPQSPSSEQITTLLDTLGAIGAETGYPALAVTLTSDWQQAREADFDTLLIGELPAEFRHDAEPDALLASTRSWVNRPRRENRPELAGSPSDRQPESRVAMTGNRAIAAIVGLQSPVHPQRSMVAMLADGPAGARLLNETLQQNDLRSQVAGSVAIIRASGVSSLAVGERYTVGYLPWWEHIWQQFAHHPLRLVGLTVTCMLLLGWGLRVLLAGISRRRLKEK